MAKILKQLVFGAKKNPPAPPRPDYEGERLAEQVPFHGHDYENIPRSKGRIHFAEEKEVQPELFIFDNYSEPADLRVELSSTLKDEDPLYMSPLDDRGTAPPLEEEEDMYCMPYETNPPTCLNHTESVDESRPSEPVEEDTTYDVVPDVKEDDDERRKDDDASLQQPTIVSKEDEYDEPWEWAVGTRLTHSLQVSPTQSLEGDDSDPEGDSMTARQQRHLLYETAFDSKVKRDTDDLDRLVQSPLFVSRNESVARAASRSSVGSTSGSSASSTPTHQPMEVAARQSPRQHPTPTERRRVTLIRDGRSVSPRDSSIRNQIVNRNFERRMSFSNSSQWDSLSRCSGSSDKSSSQESMNVEVGSRNVLGRSASRDSLNRCHYPNSWKECGDKLQNSSEGAENNDVAATRGVAGTKVLPTDNSSSRLYKDPELKENTSPSSRRLLPEVKPADTLPQSPENDLRSSRDYDPPWDRKGMRPMGSVSVPERLSSGASPLHLPTSVTHDKLEAVEEGKDKTSRLTGASPRPSLNLSFHSDSPRKARQNLMLNFGCSALSAVGEKVDSQLTLEKQGWYHGSISRVDAEAKLRVLKEGSYLVRNSESSKQDYSLSLKSARGFMHMKIVPTSEGHFILGQFSNPFPSIPEMIQHYSKNKLPIKGAEHMSLLYPVIEQLL